MRQFYQIGVAPRPGIEPIKGMTKDEAVLRILDSFNERFPDCFIVATFVEKIGRTYSYVISIEGESDDF